MFTSTTRYALTAAAVAAIAASTAAAAVPSAATTTDTTTASTAKPPTVKTSRMDIDGDGRRDTTTLRLTKPTNTRYTYTLETRTARGARASTPVVISDNGEDIDAIWWGAAGLDGTPGAEIVLNPSPVGDGASLRVYRWHKGKLVPQAVPGTRTWRNGGQDWMTVNMPWGIQGYTFYTSRGVRYVVDHDLKPYRSTGKFSGTHTTYRWNTKTATWSKVSTKRAGLVSDAYAQQKYGGVFGVTFR